MQALVGISGQNGSLIFTLINRFAHQLVRPFTELSQQRELLIIEHGNQIVIEIIIRIWV